MLEHLAQICRKRFQTTILLTLAIEAVTLFLRFGLGLKSTEHTASTIGQVTRGIRLHHGYAGLVLLPLLLLPKFKEQRSADAIFVVGMSLLVSDFIHHTLLYFVTSSPEFDLVYPRVSL